MIRDWLTVPDAEHFTQIPRSTWYRWARTQHVHSRTSCGTVFIYYPHVVRELDKRKARDTRYA